MKKTVEEFCKELEKQEWIELRKDFWDKARKEMEKEREKDIESKKFLIENKDLFFEAIIIII